MPQKSQGTPRPLHRSQLLARLLDRAARVPVPDDPEPQMLKFEVVPDEPNTPEFEVVPDEPLFPPEFEVVPDEPEPNLRDLPQWEWEPGAVLEF